jgi:hypothetical protein
MSGEMNTSSGNGLMNLIILSYIAWKKGGSVKAVVEGDDGLLATDVTYSTDDFTRIGIRCKLEPRQSIAVSQFCGLCFDEIELENITDPRVVLHEFAWTSRRYVGASDRKLMGLLRCKALSYLY